LNGQMKNFVGGHVFNEVFFTAVKIPAKNNVCRQGMYLHGAIGWTEEMDIGLYHLRTLSWDFDGGGSRYHKEQIAYELENRTPYFKKLYAS
jgi:hypothetical protein